MTTEDILKKGFFKNDRRKKEMQPNDAIKVITEFQEYLHPNSPLKIDDLSFAHNDLSKAFDAAKYALKKLDQDFVKVL
jgi:hypothetical protein